MDAARSLHGPDATSAAGAVASAPASVGTVAAMVIYVDEYDPAWPAHAQAAIAELQAAHPGLFTAVEHVGSTAIPGLPAKPVIDLMAAVAVLGAAPEIGLGYALVDTGMPQRYFYRREAGPGAGRDGGASASGAGASGGRALPVHLHVVSLASWETRNERLLRNFLGRHPAARDEYGRLKQRLAAAGHDGDSYTRGKTGLIQRFVDAARDELGLARVSVWEE
ncbi:hypothetical protein GCM10018962_74230 [Dactylosporangium matsuzakiense]|uniref:GrpB family protein n=2 Tax=Dactylosporangium matsuzakiense TaxID=53360 RepID=A0A9W6KR37_9ACTN|nr:hypothetical protein GCM10017581_074650 [Dactylosporangium matsuzakiense]